MNITKIWGGFWFRNLLEEDSDSEDDFKYINIVNLWGNEFKKEYMFFRK